MEMINEYLQNRGLQNLLMSDPVVTALETAVQASISSSSSAVEAASLAARSLPPNSTDFERGMAFGMALTLTSP